MNRTNFEHAAYALAMQAVIGLLSGNWWAGAAFGIAFFLGREQAQAENRYINAYGGNRYATPQSPVIGSLKLASWNTDSVLDFVFPTVACVLALAAAGWLGLLSINAK